MDTRLSIDIDAPPEAVWAVLIDVDRWPTWTASMSSVERLDGRPLGTGSRVRIKQPRFPALVWMVTEFEPGRAFTWEARSPGSRTSAGHRVDPRGDRGSTLTLAVRQAGPLAKLVQPFVVRITRRYVRMEAEGLKRRCEGGTSAEA